MIQGRINVMKMKSIPGGGYRLDLEGHEFVVELDTSMRAGINGGAVANRVYWAKIDGQNMGGPYELASMARARLEPFMQRVLKAAEIERRRERIGIALSDLYPAGIPAEVQEALANWDGKPVEAKINERPDELSDPTEDDPNDEPWPGDVDHVPDTKFDPEPEDVPDKADASDVVETLRGTTGRKSSRSKAKADA